MLKFDYQDIVDALNETGPSWLTYGFIESGESYKPHDWAKMPNAFIMVNGMFADYQIAEPGDLVIATDTSSGQLVQEIFQCGGNGIPPLPIKHYSHDTHEMERDLEIFDRPLVNHIMNSTPAMAVALGHIHKMQRPGAAVVITREEEQRFINLIWDNVQTRPE